MPNNSAVIFTYKSFLCAVNSCIMLILLSGIVSYPRHLYKSCLGMAMPAIRALLNVPRIKRFHLSDISRHATETVVVKFFKANEEM
jgi:hypothetical protein